MILDNLLEVQKKLDAEIELKHPVATGEDRLSDKILALQVELGECANEWRGFKFWSTDREPRIFKARPIEITEAATPKGFASSNPLLEEYVDCLHFILSIGIEIGLTAITCDGSTRGRNLNEQFRGINFEVATFDNFRSFNNFHNVLSVFKGLGEMLGFDWEQIESAYYAKNEINHQRQESGY